MLTEGSIQKSDGEKSYRSMKLSERVQYNNQKMMEDAGMLPGIDSHKKSQASSRVQSAVKRSSTGKSLQS